jgi:predicted nucleotidyltransferase
LCRGNRALKKIDEIKKVLGVYKEELYDKYGVKSIGFFGSYVRGEQRESSDLDILVEFERPISLLKLVNLENYLTDILGLKVDVIPKEDVRPELKKEIFAQALYL